MIGARVVARLRGDGHDVVVAARATGVNSFTAEGLDDALVGADTIVDVSNSSYIDEAAAREFFYASTMNLLTYGAAAGVSHHVALSVVGTDRLARAEGGYFQAKASQEALISKSGRPYSIVHATQFFEFIRSIVADSTRGGVATLADVFMQPMAADDVAAAVALASVAQPSNAMRKFAGPDVFRLPDLACQEMRWADDERDVVADPLGTYFGARLAPYDFLPSPQATISTTRFRDWRTGAPRAGRSSEVEQPSWPATA